MVVQDVANFPKIVQPGKDISLDVKAGIMSQAAVCGVDSSDESLYLESAVWRESSLDDILTYLLELDEIISEVSQCRVGYVSASGLDDAAYDLDSACRFLEVEFLWMQLVVKKIPQEYVDHILDVDHVVFSSADDRHIIHESDVSSATSGGQLQYEFVQK